MNASVPGWQCSRRLFALFGLFSPMSLFAFVGEGPYRWTYLTYLSFLTFLLYLIPQRYMQPRRECPATDLGTHP